MREKFEPKRFEPRKFEYRRFNDKPSFHSPKEVIFESRAKAEEIWLAVNDVIDKYGYATVSDVYDLVDANSNYLDTKYGWASGLTDELIVSTDDGWIIDFPDACEI